MSTAVCVRCKKHVSIYYIDAKTNLCWDCEKGSLDYLKIDPRFVVPNKEPKEKTK